MTIITEEMFRARLVKVLSEYPYRVKSVTGPGRSGAIAAVYTSHYLGIPFLPYGTKVPEQLKPVLLVDTAIQSGRTLRKAARKYDSLFEIAFFLEPPRVKFWYEKEIYAKRTD